MAPTAFLVRALAALACVCTQAQAATPAVSAGGSHLLALHRDGSVKAWGNDAQGQLGMRSLRSTAPATVPGLAGATRAAAGTYHSLVLLADGTVMGWGYNITGNVGDGTFFERTRPTAARAGSFTAIAGGGHQSFGIQADGSLWAWGYNHLGQLGDGTRTVRLVPQRLSTISNVRGVATTWGHTVAVKNDGTVWTWGSNSFGQLGTGPGADRDLPAQVPTLANVVAVSAPTDGDLAAALKADGTVWTWGVNFSGQLGDGTTTHRSVPVQVAGLTGVVAIAAGFQHMLALRSDGTVWSWGRNFEGQLGTGNQVDRFTAGPVPGLTGIARISVGKDHSIAVGSDGRLWTWGANAYGQLGDGTTANRVAPFQVPGMTSVAWAVAGGDHTLVVRTDGTVATWGSRLYGLAGDGAAITRSVPGGVAGISGVAALGTGQEHNLAIRADGSVWAWGSNVAGQLGDGTYVSRETPAPVSGLANIVEVTGGSGHSLARAADGRLYAWGYNTDGELGDGTSNWRLVPGLVAGLFVKSIAAGYQHTAVVDTAGAVWTWGLNNYGQLGDGTTVTRLSPTRVQGLANVVAVSARGWSTLALRADGTVWAWGSNNYGQLGDGSRVDRALPVQVAGLANVAAVTNAFIRSYALKHDGTVWAWGAGPLGNGDFADSSTPLQVAGLSNVAAIVANGFHVAALRADGTLLAWGDNSYAQLGDGTYTVRLRPTAVLAADGTGSLDNGDWFLRLDSTAASVPAAFTPAALAVAQASGATDRLRLDSRVKYRSADLGKAVNQYVIALVPPEFFNLVATAPGTLGAEALRAKAGETLVLAQLTPAGWTNVLGQLIAYSQATASAAGNAANILNGIDATRIPGARFCIGYGESAQSLLTERALQDVLSLEGATASASGMPCVLTGVYVDGPAASRAGTPVTFRAMVVGLSPTGTLQFHDGDSPLHLPRAVTPANEAVANAAFTTTALAVGRHAITAAYSGDAQNAAVRVADVLPLRHEVIGGPASTTIDVFGPASSLFGSEVVFSATVTGNQPGGTVQFRDSGADIGAPQPLVGAQATIRLGALALGAHQISAAYLGDANNAASSSSALGHFVDSQPPTAVALAASRNPALHGESITLTATVTGASPAGSVEFLDGARVLTTAPLLSGSAAVTVVALDPGLHVVTARYGGDSLNRAATSAALFLQVNLAPAATALRFPPRENVAPGAMVTSAAVTYSGPAGQALVQGGEVSIGCNGTFTAQPAPIANGQRVCLRHAASPDFATQARTTLSIGAVSSVFQSTTYAASFRDAISTLVTHYYQATLRRPPDAGGKAFWEAQAARLVELEVSVLEAFFAMATQFFASAEYLATPRSNAEFVTDLYRTFFNRDPDAGGLDFWAGEIAAGMPRQVVLVSFMFSAEFAAFTTDLFGFDAARPEVDAVIDFYRGLLSRLPETQGFEFWLARFRTAQCDSPGAVYDAVEAISAEYVASPEFQGRNRSNAEFVGDLYNAFMRRGGDRAGVAHWIGQLDAGLLNRTNLRRAFIGTTEFAARVQAIIARGCYAR